MIELRDTASEMNTIFMKIYEELRTVPITLMFMAGIYVAVGILWNDHVSKADFHELKTQMVNVQYTLQKDHADTRLHSVQQEMFTLTEHVTEEHEKGHSVDNLYGQRLDELKNQQDDLLRLINRLDQMNRLGEFQ